MNTVWLWASLYVRTFVSFNSKEIEETLEKLKKHERQLAAKEIELKQKERELDVKQRQLEKQFNVVVNDSVVIAMQYNSYCVPV